MYDPIRSRALLALLLLATLLLATVAPAAAQEAPPEQLSGEYRFVSGRRSIVQSVNEVCDAFDFVTRAFARPILEDRNQPYERVRLELDPDGARFTFGPWGPVHTRFGETRTFENERGEQVRVRQLRMGDRLVQFLTTDQGTRRNVIQASPDGRRLTVETLITSPRLPVPLRYRLVFAPAGRPTGLAAK